MRLVIQIPCLDEEANLPGTLADLPREVSGIDEVIWLVVDDGSSDATSQVAVEHGVDYVVRFPGNRGLARAFEAGVDAALKLGADVVVNTDADNQYRGQDIERLVAPIVNGEADIVIGDRQTHAHPDFSSTKKRLQRVGSSVVRAASGSSVADAPSGFRAYSRDAALGMNVVSNFSYTLETIIHAGKNQMTIANVPIGVNSVERPSRLFQSQSRYVLRSGLTVLRTWAMHSPIKVFLTAGFVFSIGGLALFLRFLILFAIGDGLSGHVQSLILGAVLLVFGVQFVALAIIGDLLRTNRVLIERTLRETRTLSADSDGPRPTHGVRTGAWRDPLP